MKKLEDRVRRLECIWIYSIGIAVMIAGFAILVYSAPQETVVSWQWIGHMVGFIGGISIVIIGFAWMQAM